MADVENEQQSELAGGVAEEEVPEKTAIDQINDGVEKVVLTTENQNSKKKNKKKVCVDCVSIFSDVNPDPHNLMNTDPNPGQ